MMRIDRCHIQHEDEHVTYAEARGTFWVPITSCAGTLLVLNAAVLLANEGGVSF